MGRLLHRPPLVSSDLRRKPGGTSLQIYRQARVGRATECNHEPVQATAELLYCQSSGTVPNFKSGSNCTTGEGGSSEEGGGRQDGESSEGGAQSSVDGFPERTRLGKEGEMPWDLVENGF